MQKPLFYEYFAELTPLLMYPACEPMGRRMERYWKACVKQQVVPIKGVNARYYIRRKETLKAGEIIVKRILKNPALFGKSLKDFTNEFKKLEKLIKKTRFRPLPMLSETDLIALEKELNDAYSACYVPSYLMEPSYFYLEHKIREKLGAFLKEKGLENKYSQYFVDLTPISGELFHISEEKDLLEIMALIGMEEMLKKAFRGLIHEIRDSLKKYPTIEKRLLLHIEKFHWINNNYAYTPYLNINYFINMLREKFKACTDPKKHLDEFKMKEKGKLLARDKVQEELRLPPKLTALLDLVSKLAYYQDYRKTSMLKAVYWSHLLANELEKRYGIEKDLLLYALPTEIKEQYLADRKFLSELKIRRTNCLLIFGYDNVKIYSGKDAHAREKRLLKGFGHSGKSAVASVRGTCASLGYAVGKAKLVLLSADIPKVEEGEVLIAHATRPEMVPAMKKACAIVTDEGGITSHAAIVSRELGIPCIIGTRIATRVFKDGDLLEVKANHGEVNKLEG
ncbi:MAG: PEP-utilizing enzyme [Candidatus Micrarchaeota archaeon]